MKLKYNHAQELWIQGFGVHNPQDKPFEINEERGKKMLETGYFDEIKKKKQRLRGSYIRKKSKKKGVDKL